MQREASTRGRCSKRGAISKSSPVTVSRLPIARAAGQQIEYVPQGAEIVARAEAGVRHTQDPVGLASEHGNAWQPAVGPQRAVRAGGTHVVDYDQVGLVSKQLREAHRAIGVREDIIRHFFGLS